MLGIDAEAGINVTTFLANSGAIYAPVTDQLTIQDGRLRDDLYLTIGDFDARIGRLLDNSLDPNEWLLSSLDDNFFENGALSTGQREEDYRCTGNPSFIGNGNAVLSMTFDYNNPSVNCSGVLAFYRLPYVLQVPVQSIEQQLGNYIETARLSNTVQINPTSSTRLEQAIVSTSRVQALAEQGAVPELVISQDAIALGVSDVEAATELAETFGVRASSQTGVVQIDLADIIQIGLPVTQTAPDLIETDSTQESEETDEEQAEDAADAEQTEQPLAAIPSAEADEIGPISLLLN